MNNNQFSEKNRFYYTVIALSVLAVLAASVGIYTTAKKIRSRSKEPTHSTVEITLTTEPREKPANRKQPGVKDERTTETTKPEEISEPTTKMAETTEAVVTTQHDVECELPLSDDILKDYSNGAPVRSKTMNDYRTHNGVDFTGEQGDEIRAVCAGKVTEIKADSSWGNVVVIEHENGLTARYCGFSDVEVNEGDAVSKGEKIGTLGVIPIESADTPHLHLEMLRDGKYTDPVEALSLQREE